MREETGARSTWRSAGLLYGAGLLDLMDGRPLRPLVVQKGRAAPAADREEP